MQSTRPSLIRGKKTDDPVYFQTTCIICKWWKNTAVFSNFSLAKQSIEFLDGVDYYVWPRYM
jgi:hypothetical protein